MEKGGNNIKPENFSIEVLLPHYIVEDLKDIAQFHQVNMKEVVIRAVLSYHAQMMAEHIQSER